MSDKTGIEWADATWNPVWGCTPVSPGCDHCYAETLVNGRLAHLHPGGFAKVRLRPEQLDKPLRWRRPRRIFVNSMSDLFHDDIPDDYIARVFAVMAYAHQHTFQLLTKRHGRMRSLLSSPAFAKLVDAEWCGVQDWFWGRLPDLDYMYPTASPHGSNWPLPNVWLGVSVENQQWADIRIPALLETPAAVRFLSCEPLLGPTDIALYLDPSRGVDSRGKAIDWVIVGGESGHDARPMHPDWARSLRTQCHTAGVAFLFKQWGEWVPEQQSPEDVVIPGQVRYHEWRDGSPDSLRLGKKAAGRELDGRTWDEYARAVTHG
jgi:protein gp37